MMIRLITILIVLWAPQLFAQELICPSNVTKKCYDTTEELPEIIDGNGYELKTQKEFVGNSCEERMVNIRHSLLDKETGQEAANCSYVITIRPYNELTLFPKDTIISGKTIAEVYNESVYTDGMFPIGTSDCNLTFSFEDILVEMFPNVFIYRHWSAKNECDNTLALATQNIRLTNIPHRSISVQVEECGGVEILLDSIEILYNGTPISLGDCFTPFDTLYQTLNCLADSLLINDDDALSLRLDDITNPYIGVSLIDVIDIQRHILGLKRFEEPCRLSAGDVNRDGRINGLDLVELKKLILGIYTRWPYGNGPEITVNGMLRDELSFTKGDFPLSKLEIIITNQGNPSTN